MTKQLKIPYESPRAEVFLLPECTHLLTSLSLQGDFEEIIIDEPGADIIYEEL